MEMYEDRFKAPAKQYTVEEVVKSAMDSKVWDTFNNDDIKLMKSNPNIGIQMVNYKKDYINAPEGEAGDYTRGIARAGMEYLRRNYGGYTTNADGSVATPAGVDKPTGVGAIKTVKNNSGGDDLYKNYEKTLLDAQSKAQENVYGMVTAGTGGNASSSAVTKAAAAGADFSQLLAEKKMEYENQEYNRKLSEAQLAAQLGDFSKLRAMGIDTSSYEADIAATKAKAERETALNEALTAMEIGDFSKLAALGFDTSYLEKIQGDEAAQKELAEAIQLATSLGIYGPLESLGYDTEWLRGRQGDTSNTAAADVSAPVVEDTVDTGEDDEETAPFTPKSPFYRTAYYATKKILTEDKTNGNDKAWKILDFLVQIGTLQDVEANRIALELKIYEPGA